MGGGGGVMEGEGSPHVRACRWPEPLASVDQARLPFLPRHPPLTAPTSPIPPRPHPPFPCPLHPFIPAETSLTKKQINN